MARAPSPPAAAPDGARLLRRGKVKEVYDVSPSELEFRFTDDISVFDKHIPNAIPGKGETLAGTAAHWFEMCGKLGVNHHYQGLTGPNRMRVRRVEVVPHPKAVGGKFKSVFIPLEFVTRYYVAGSLWDRVKSGALGASDLGFEAGHAVAYGDKLPAPMFETTTKLEKVDRLLTEKDALELAGITPKHLGEIHAMILRIDDGMQKEIQPRGLLHVDGKKEFGFDAEGRLMVVDTFGTADEDRFWDLHAYERGQFQEFSKEFVRQHYRKSGYYDLLSKAREAHREEPPIPALPPNLVHEVSRLYTSVYERLTGKAFQHAAAA